MSIVELTGTVSDYDSDGLYGLIDADDGRLLVFNLSAAPPDLLQQFRVGMRVTFELESIRADRAIVPLPIGEAGTNARSTLRPLERGADRS